MMGMMLAGQGEPRSVAAGTQVARRVGSEVPLPMYKNHNIDGIDLDDYKSISEYFRGALRITVDSTKIPWKLPSPFDSAGHVADYATVLSPKPSDPDRAERWNRAEDEVERLESIVRDISDGAENQEFDAKARYISTYSYLAFHGGARMAHLRSSESKEIGRVGEEFSRRRADLDLYHKKIAENMEANHNAELERIRDSKGGVSKLRPLLKRAVVSSTLALGSLFSIPDERVKVLAAAGGVLSTFLLAGPVEIWWYGRETQKENNTYTTFVDMGLREQRNDIEDQEYDRKTTIEGRTRYWDRRKNELLIQVTLDAIYGSQECFPDSVRMLRKPVTPSQNDVSTEEAH